MRKVVMTLVVAVLVCVASSVNAGLCPQYLYGQWNGIYYYYCTPDGMCSNGSPQPGQSTDGNKMLGCDPQMTTKCKDPNPILPLVVKLKGDGKDKTDREVQITKTGGIKKKMKARKSGGGPGQSDDPAFTFNLQSAKAKFVPENGGKKSDRPVFVKAKDKNGNPQTFYFRVLELELEHPTNPAMKIPSFVGQQLEAVPTTTEELFYAASDGPFDHVLTNRAGDRFHVASFDEIKAP